MIAKFTASAPPSPRMAINGWSWLDVSGYVAKFLKIVLTAGPDALKLLQDTMVLVQDFTTLDLSKIIADAGIVGADIQKLIEDVKAKFEIVD